jgi:hypothetical protein
MGLRILKLIEKGHAYFFVNEKEKGCGEFPQTERIERRIAEFSRYTISSHRNPSAP